MYTRSELYAQAILRIYIEKASEKRKSNLEVAIDWVVLVFCTSDVPCRPLVVLFNLKNTMIKKSTLPVALGMLFALAIAMPVSADTTVVTDVATVTTDAETTSVTTNQATVRTESFEKILERMRVKIAARNATGTKSTTTPETKGTRALGTALKTVDASCIVKLVDAREVSIQNAWATFNTSMADALKARHAALVAAWGKTDVTARVEEIKTTMKTWRDAHKAMFTKLKTNRKTAWATFKTKAKNECKVIVPMEEKLSSDTTGTIAL